MHTPRVCMVISSFHPVVGGAEIRTERLARKLIPRGIDLVVLTRRYPGLSARDSINSLPIMRLGLPSRRKVGSMTFVIHALWVLARELREYEVVHVQSPDAPLLIGMLAKLLLRRRLVVTVRSDPQRVWGSMGRLRKRLFPQLVDVVAGLNPEMSSRLAVSGLPSGRIKCLPGGVDTEAYHPPAPAKREDLRREMEIPRDAIVYLFVGRLDPVKDLPTLLDAWRVSESNGARHLLIVGDGAQRAELEGMATASGLKNVRFVGETNEVLRYLQCADVFVLPSRWEGVSNALLEAMSAGLAVVVSDIPSNRVVVENGQAGMLFECANPQSLSIAIQAMEDRALREQFGDRARALVQRKYSLEASVAMHARLYSDLARHQSSVAVSVAAR